MTTIISNQDSSWHDVAHAAVLHPYCVILFILPDKHLSILQIHYLQFPSPHGMWTLAIYCEVTLHACLS